MLLDSNELNERTFLEFKTREALIIENLNEKISEKLLFSLWNLAMQDNKYFLIDWNESRLECNDPIAQILFVLINSEKLLEFFNYLFLNIVSIFSVD